MRQPSRYDSLWDEEAPLWSQNANWQTFWSDHNYPANGHQQRRQPGRDVSTGYPKRYLRSEANVTTHGELHNFPTDGYQQSCFPERNECVALGGKCVIPNIVLLPQNLSFTMEAKEQEPVGRKSVIFRQNTQMNIMASTKMTTQRLPVLPRHWLLDSQKSSVFSPLFLFSENQASLE